MIPKPIMSWAQEFAKVLAAIVFCSSNNWVFAQTSSKHNSTGASISHRIIIEPYAGSIDDMESQGYTQENGNCVRSKNIMGCELLLKSRCKPYIKSSGRQCIWAIGTPDYANTTLPPGFKVTDALRLALPANMMFFETDDVNCVSKAHPGAHVLAIGLWKWRVPPSNGGYAHSLKRAWIVSFESKKFVAINAKTVTCSISEDRN